MIHTMFFVEIFYSGIGLWLQMILAILLICSGVLFTGLLVKIRFPLCEALVGVFASFVWFGVYILNWLWVEPERSKKAHRKAEQKISN